MEEQRNALNQLTGKYRLAAPPQGSCAPNIKLSVDENASGTFGGLRLGMSGKPAPGSNDDYFLFQFSNFNRGSVTKLEGMPYFNSYTRVRETALEVGQPTTIKHSMTYTDNATQKEMNRDALTAVFDGPKLTIDYDRRNVDSPPLKPQQAGRCVYEKDESIDE